MFSAIKQIVLLVLLLALTDTVNAQEVNTKDSADVELSDTVVVAKPSRHHKKAVYGPLGRFNYTYLRIGTFVPCSGFANPLASGFSGSEVFLLTDDLRHDFRLGFESGKVRHFMNLKLGTPMLKLAINSGIALQAFGPAHEERDNATASTDGFYYLRLGLGPQITFKPIPELRISLYYRAGIALFYTSYANEQSTALASDVVRVDKIDIHSFYARYNGDLGFDCSWRSLCFGISYSMLRTGAASGALISGQSVDADNNTTTSITYKNGKQEGAVSRIPIDPVLNLNRLELSFGFAL